MEAAYRIRALRKTYGRSWSLTIDALDIRRGETLAVVGPTGSGKSTLLRLLHFLEPADAGSLEFEGRPVPFPVPIELRRRITMVFQRPLLLRGSVMDNVRYGLRLRGHHEAGREGEILESLGIGHLAHETAFPLSGGESQRVALARALAIGSPILLLDEPTAHLDPSHILVIERIIRSLQEDTGTTIVIVTHNLLQARRLADRVALLLEGQLIEEAETARFFDHPADPRAAAFLRGDLVW